MVALNRAIAVAETEGPGIALTAARWIVLNLDSYHLMHAARATMLRRLGRRAAARAAFERGATLAATEPDRHFLEREIQKRAT